MAGFLKVVDSHGQRIPASALTNSFEATGRGRRLGTWGMNLLGPNAVMWASLSVLRSRVRELVRNNPLAQKGVDSLVSNLVGTGIRPRWNLEDTALKAKIQQLWDDSTPEMDAYGTSDFYGLQAQVARALAESGEIFGRFRPRYSTDGLAVPLQIQLLEADYLDEVFQIMNGDNIVRMGIEYNPLMQRVAYWLWKNHPGEMFQIMNMLIRIRVPATDVLHVFRPLRPGQQRGFPWLTSVIIQLHELDQYEDAELVRKKTAAMFGGFITEPVGEGTEYSPLGRKTDDDGNGRDIIAIEPGTFPTLPPGMDVKFSQPVDVGITYEPWMKQQLRETAAGIGTTYEELTGDLSGVNYSSIRAGIVSLRRRCEMLQAHTLVHQFCRPFAARWLDSAVASGQLSIPDYSANRRIYQRISWHGQGWAWVDPLKDIMAEILEIRAGRKSLSESIIEDGRDPDAVASQIAQDNARSDSLGLILDSDPRNTAKTGVIQTGETAMAKESAVEPDPNKGAAPEVQE